MTTAAPFPLAGSVPVLHPEEPLGDADRVRLEGQLVEWGFIAFEVPGIGRLTDTVYSSFRAACESSGPRLSDYSHRVVPQTGVGGNHGYFDYGAEIPRLSGGIPDPKEFVHISGAMLENTPPGSRELLERFPQFGRAAAELYRAGFNLASQMSSLLGQFVTGQPLDLGLESDSTILRVIRYRDLAGRSVLAHEHSGIQMLGIQLPPSHGGLQYVLHDGTWVEPVLAGTDVVLCNVGRMLSKASGGRLRPSTHRVHLEVQSSAVYERYSAVLFAHPSHSAGQWEVDSNSHVRGVPGTWGDFVEHSISGLGLRAGGVD